MTPIEKLFAERHAEVSDINEHLPTLRAYASRCRTVAEIGVRSGNSTTALLAGLADAGGGTLHSFDIVGAKFAPPDIAGVCWDFKTQDTHARDFKIPPCGLLFIDGDHSFVGVTADLRQAAHASRWVIMHDTSEERDARYSEGVCPAMYGFLAANPEWRIRERFDNCNGLTVLERA